MNWLKRTLSVCVCIGAATAVFVFLQFPVSNAASYEIQGKQISYVDGQLLIRTATDQDSLFLDSLASSHSCSLLYILPCSSWFCVEFDTTESVDSVVAELEADTSIRFAFPNLHIDPGACDSPIDTLFDQQWHLYNDGSGNRKSRADIKACEAWSIQEGDPDVTVAVLDTGLPFDCGGPYPCATGDLVDWPDFPFDRITLGENYIEPAYLPDISKWGHGTAVFSVIGSVKDNTFGIAGVAPAISYFINKTYDDGQPGIGAIPFTFFEAIDAGADIVNASFGTFLGLASGGLYFEEPLIFAEENYVKPLYENGVLLVAIAHNYHEELIRVPAALSLYGTLEGFEDGWPNVIAVSGTDSQDSLFSVTEGTGNCKSNENIRTFISAPAEDVFLVP